MAILAGIDFETTGLDPKTDRIIEIGAVLYEWETSLPVQFYSTLVRPDRPIPEEITRITGITDEQVDCYGRSERAALQELENFLVFADYAMAFNGTNFDKLFYIEVCKRNGWEPSPTFWLDASLDVKWPENIKTRNLQHLAAEYLFLNPFRHRAVFDVLTMFKVVQNFNLDEIIARAKEPTLYVQIFSDYNDKEKVKALGYRWFAPKKMWWKTLKRSDYLAEKDTCGFRTELLVAPPE